MTEGGLKERGDFLKLGDNPRPPAGSILHLFLSDLLSMKRNDSCIFLIRDMRWGASLRDRSLLLFG